MYNLTTISVFCFIYSLQLLLCLFTRKGGDTIKKELLKPKIDVVFHALFRHENKHLTEALIRDILGEKVNVITTNIDRHIGISVPEQKFGIMDLRTELEGGAKCNIEIQLAEQEAEINRFLYYWASAYSEQLERGNLYNKLNKTIEIIILDHEIRELKGIEELGTKWQIRDKKTGKRILTNQLELIILEIPKAKRIYSKNNQNKISQWLMFLDNPNMEEVSNIMKENKAIKEANEELDKMSNDKKLRREAQLREKYIRDYKASMEFASKKGHQEGFKKGHIEEKLEIAKNMIKEELEIELIEKITGLENETIQNLIKELDKK